ncbi:MAG: VCBS repeat-containing protein, partial [Myxococcales bacterium]|nr:VCBS repeat-containing protein [Myxococcales bacterium]
LTVNDFAGVELHRNDGHGHFTRAADAFDNPTLFGMSHALGDFNGDGRLDVFATGMNSTTVRRLNALDLQRPDRAEQTRWRTEMTFGNRLYLGQPNGRFAMAPEAEQVAAAGWAWGVAAFDPENDGDLDLFVANGFISGRTAQD